MSLESQLDELLVKSMTEEGFRFWKALEKVFPDIWDRPSSSTGKYHRGDNGKTLSILEHTYEMVYACCKVMKLFGNATVKSKDGDVLILACLTHDMLKYGIDDPLHKKHTDKQHDRIIGNTIKFNKEKFLKFLNESQVERLENMTRYHSGQWSTDLKEDKNFKISDLKHETFFLHILDMLSTNNCLKIPKIEEN